MAALRRSLLRLCRRTEIDLGGDVCAGHGIGAVAEVACHVR
jgi:hypothetical protein